MATRAALTGTYTAGTPWGTADANSMPGGLVAYASTTSAQTGIGTSTTDLTSLTITYTFVASRIYKITGHLGLIIKQTSGGWVKILVRDGGGTAIGAIANTTLGTGERDAVDGCVFIQPSAGSATYKLSGQAQSDTFDTGASSGDPGPAFLLIEDCGPSF